MVGRGGEIDTGALCREAHRGCWRADAPPLDFERREVVALMPLLIRTGSVGLVWSRLRHRSAELGAIGAGLEAAYRSQIAHNARVEREIARVVGHLRGHGIEPVLIKGWAVSRLYPAAIVRPAGDIDLVVRDGDYERAKTLLAGSGISLHGDAVGRTIGDDAEDGLGVGGIDLHTPKTWKDYPGDGFFDRATAASAGGVTVMVPGAEDHLRALCNHYLRHGGSRPPRLVDIAMLWETRPAGFDTERLLRGSAREAERVTVSLGLARELLGADLGDGDIAPALPGWLAPEIERQWALNLTPPSQTFVAEVRANPRAIASIFRRRWPQPVTATVRLGAPFNGFPRLPIQTAAYLGQIASYGTSRLPKQIAAAARGR